MLNSPIALLQNNEVLNGPDTYENREQPTPEDIKRPAGGRRGHEFR